MGDHERKIFQVELLKKAGFPKLDGKGKNACQHEIETWGMKQFLDDGWSSIQQEDEVLSHWLERLISEEIAEKPAVEKEEASRSIRYGAALVYYPLFLQAEKSRGMYVMPKASLSQEGSLRFDLGEEDVQSWAKFLLAFDEDLAAVIGGFIGNPVLSERLGVTKDEVYLGAFFTYFVLANKAESLGMGAVYGNTGEGK